MGRNLLKVPLHVLLAQAEETRIHLRALLPVREAFLATRLDLPMLEAELEAAIAAGLAALTAVGLADTDVRLESVVREEVCTGYRQWATWLRRRLDLAAATGDAVQRESASLVRARIGRHAGARFLGTLSALRAVIPELEAHAERLGTAAWEAERLAVPVALRETAEGSAARNLEQVAHQNQCGRDATVARERLREILTALRAAWTLALDGRRGLPGMPLGVLERYAARGMEEEL